MTRNRPAAVAVFDAELPPAVSFIRSLGSAGVELHAFSSDERAAGRYSRHVSSFATCPSNLQTDSFVDWLEREVERERFDLIAPTSDYVAFATAELDDRLGTNFLGGVGGAAGPSAVLDCLFKDRFARRMEGLDFPLPAWAAPTSNADARRAGESMRFPLVVKPRSHIGVGLARGEVVDDLAALDRAFGPYQLDAAQTSALRHDPDIAWPILQEMVGGPDAEVISITGCLDQDGHLDDVGVTRKLSQWGSSLGIGTLFEAMAAPSFVEQAVEAVRAVLGTGVFELEVLVDHSSGDYWAIELNPRGFGQMELDVRRGRDLPRSWYAAATGRPLPVAEVPRRRPEQWRMGLPYYAGVAVSIARGPARTASLRELVGSRRRRAVGSMHRLSDPLPGLRFSSVILRHPGGLVRPFLERDRT